MTIGAIMELNARGVAIPGDMSVVSFDDSEVFRMATPPITVVAQPLAEMARALAARVVAATGRAGPGDDAKSDNNNKGRLPCKMILRGSVAPPGTDQRGAFADVGR